MSEVLGRARPPELNRQQFWLQRFHQELETILHAIRWHVVATISVMLKDGS
jgi:hypothetical protein